MFKKILNKIKYKIFKPKYPCQECFLILAGAQCIELCDKVEQDNNKVKQFLETFKCCPDCGSLKFLRGPSGGFSENMRCATCGHNYNIALPWFVERISNV